MTAEGASCYMSAIWELEKASNVHNIITLHHHAFMFHQANMRKSGIKFTVINRVPGNFSSLQMWVDTIVTEYASVWVFNPSLHAEKFG